MTSERIEDRPEDNAGEKPTTGGWFSRLKAGLSRSSARLTDGITGIFTKRKLDDAALEELEELLITADLGPATAAKLTAELARTKFGNDVSADEVRRALAEQVAAILEPVAKPLTIGAEQQPMVILVVGVNGTGKTTTIGKLAAQWRSQGRSVMMAAGDTFRAAAIGQLRVWGERAGVPVISGKPGAEIARELGIKRNQLYKWQQQLAAKGKDDAFPGHGKQLGEAAELTRLERDNARLKEENEILKKAARYFARESS